MACGDRGERHGYRPAAPHPSRRRSEGTGGVGR